jgi:site-specific recombinase XerD
MLAAYFTSPQRLQELRDGRGGALLERFSEALKECGYSERTARLHIRAAAHLLYWAGVEGVPADTPNETILRQFDKHLVRCRCPGFGHARRDLLIGGRAFLRHLQEIGVTNASTIDPATQPPALLTSFCDWMRAQRGTADVTLYSYGLMIRALLTALGEDPGKFDAQSVRQFVLGQTRDRGWAVAKKCTTALHMFFRFLIAEGKCDSRLAAAIPVVAHWHLSTLPRYLQPEAVERVIASCNLTSPSGKRDRAILLLLARLGLRAGDILEMRVDDIDWKGAWITVRGKGRRLTKLPLTQEVGQAVVDYLKEGRPSVETDILFVRSRAPFRAFADHSAISVIVGRAMRLAGVTCPSRGAAHVLRHSVATSMLRHGASLQDIAAVLRHRSIETTQIYARVDISMLKEIAQPWPEVQPCYLKPWSRI